MQKLKSQLAYFAGNCKKIYLGAVAILFLCSVLTLSSYAQPFLPETAIASLPGITNFHDVVINCDMLEHYNGDDDRGTIKAIVSDNGERFNTTGNQAESWLYVEDHQGYTQTLSLGMDIKQPDVVIANDIGRFDGATPDYIIGIVHIEESAASGYTTGQVMMRTYGVFNVGSPSLSVSLLQQVPLGTTSSNTSHGNEDGNPHIDMWTNVGYLVRGLHSLREFAVCWSQGYVYSSCGGYTSSPGRLMYSWGDINNIWSANGNAIPTGYYCSGMSDIACYTNAENGQ